MRPCNGHRHSHDGSIGAESGRDADSDAPKPEDEEPEPKPAPTPTAPAKPHPSERRPWPDTIIRKEGTDNEHHP